MACKRAWIQGARSEGDGFGWRRIYAVEKGAASVTGVDISEKMCAVAREKTPFTNVSYVCAAIEDYEYPENGFDIMVSYYYLLVFSWKDEKK